MNPGTDPDAGGGVTVQYASEDDGLPDEAALRRWAAAALAAQNARGAVCVRLVDEAEGRALNARYRGRDHATNVLSFGVDASLPAAEGLLGDLALCAPVVAREADAQGKTRRAHYAHLTVHGVLHLLGHDHQHPGEAERMEALERRILAALGFADPYSNDTLDPGIATREAKRPPS